MPQVYLVTGASTGFGRLISRALALAGHTVFAGQYRHDGNLQPQLDEIAQFSQQHNVDLRPISLDLLSDSSVSAAVTQILQATHNRLDGIVHNAGHMGFGFAEAFTPDQYAAMYAINVLGPQRLNQHVLPHLRSQRSGHLIWISSSSVHGGKGPNLGPYFAAKAAMDSLALTYAYELHPWGIETSIVVPGVFPTGTAHFTDAAKPGVEAVEREYEQGPTGWVKEQSMKGLGDVAPPDADANLVAEVVVEVANAPRGKKPLRVFADPAEDGCEVAAPVNDRMSTDFYRRCGLGSLLKVSLEK